MNCVFSCENLSDKLSHLHETPGLEYMNGQPGICEKNSLCILSLHCIADHSSYFYEHSNCLLSHVRRQWRAGY